CGLCRRPGHDRGTFPVELAREVLCDDRRRGPQPRQTMNALGIAAIYFGAFVAIGLVASYAAKSWLNLRDIDLSEIRTQFGPNRRKSSRFLLGICRKEDPD